MLRTGSKGLAAATLLLDAAKGALAVWLAQHFWPGCELHAAAGALIGHLYPLWLRFKGGKGVATLLGILVALLPVAALVYAVVWIGAAAGRADFVGRRDGRGGERAGHRGGGRRRARFPAAARLRDPRDLEASRQYPPAAAGDEPRVGRAKA